MYALTDFSVDIRTVSECLCSFTSFSVVIFIENYPNPFGCKNNRRGVGWGGGGGGGGKPPVASTEIHPVLLL